ncbi:Adenosylhomocysteinase [Candidatus Syntrophocurvum alkaliphilum]|uniref:Adenosylhomocysteinase n=1 Tax=Candidatus Syntrophocurvum alkaliphilum TaxID=2293317 RepID=A0A6I6DD28_9FIRM|nr:adenosylhomocysteinase [Candidatus Syntrophocurvum alkaliphilum]QGT99244.1 Adenosylhomocysteinase [Candidatus Syntrophocurvum alkaliphilum]
MNTIINEKSRRKSIIKDISLASSGYKKLAWASKNMPVLNILKEEYKNNQPLKGKIIVCCLHLEAKTGYLLQTLQTAGADVVACASNPLSTQDDVVAALVDSGITVYAYYGESTEDYHRFLEYALDCMPDAIIDDGADVVSILHKTRKEQAKNIIGGCEETTTGIVRLKSMDKDKALLFPMMAVNDAYMKYLFDNRYGTGQSVWDGINRTTNLVVAGKSVVVIGYGWCGKGVAMRALGMGAKIIVTEIDPIKANEALMDGFEVMPMSEAAKIGDIFITVTGNINVIRKEHMEVMKDNAIMCNAGHFDVEVSKGDLEALSVSKRIVRDNIEEFVLEDNRKLYLLAEGRLVNLAAGDGHPAEVMDLSFSLQALSLMYVIENRDKLANHVYNVPESIDEKVAYMKLKAEGINIDKLTDEQQAYIDSWDV